MRHIEFSKLQYEKAVAFVAENSRYFDDEDEARRVLDLLLGDMSLNERYDKIQLGGFMVSVETLGGRLEGRSMTRVAIAVDPAMGVLGTWAEENLSVFGKKGE